MHSNTILFYAISADVCTNVGNNVPWIPHMTGVGEGGPSGIIILGPSHSIKKQLRGIQCLMKIIFQKHVLIYFRVAIFILSLEIPMNPVYYRHILEVSRITVVKPTR